MTPEEIAALPPLEQAHVRACMTSQARALAAVGKDEPGVVFNEDDLAPVDFARRLFLGEPVWLRGVMAQLHENVMSLTGSDDEEGVLRALAGALEEADANAEERLAGLRATLFVQFAQAAALFYRLGRETERMEAGR